MAINMKENTKMIKEMAEGPFNIRMEIFIMVTGKMI